MLLRVGRLALSLLIVSTSVPALGRAPVPAAAADAPAESLDAAPAPDSILGEWWSEGKEGRLKIEKVRGYFAIPLLGQTQTWTRAS